MYNELRTVRGHLAVRLEMGEYKIAAGNFKSTFKRGATALLVLTLLQERDMYGYEIIQTLIKRSNGNFFIPEGSLYPSLYKMIENGFISSREVTVGRTATRVYYHLEDAGRLHLKQLLSDYQAVKNDIETILSRSGENATDEE